MSMPITDYNQRLLGYLQNWQQFLEQWAAMAGAPFLAGPHVVPTAPAGAPYIPPTAPFMAFMPPMPPIPMGPPTAPMPSAPVDYTQQLFSYLQAWRQYLEQAMGASPAPPQAWNAQQPTAAPANAGGPGTWPPNPPNPPKPPNPPVSPPENKSGPQSGDKKGSDGIPPKLLNRAPNVFNQTAQAEIGLDPAIFEVDRPGERFQMPDPAILSARPGASHPASEALARPEAGSAFVSAMNRVEPITSPPVVQRSLFSTPGTSARLRDTGEMPSP